MLKNHLKSIFRSLIKSKGYSAINIAGLAIGFAAAILISIYVRQELTFDKHYKDYESTYRLSNRAFALSSIAHLDHLKNNASGLKAWVNIMPNPSATLKHEGESFVEKDFFYATSDYLAVFDHPFVLGNPQTAMDEANSLILTESMVNKMFKSENPIGQLVTISTQLSEEVFQVTGVIRDLPLNTSLNFKAIARVPKEFEERIKTNFSFTTGYSYFKMETALETALVQETSDQVFGLQRYEESSKDQSLASYIEEKRKSLPLVMRLDEIHLNSNARFEVSPPGNKQYLMIFLGIALFIIILAGINYVNLATAQASKRAKEVGIRKVLGSYRSHLITRFLTESFVLVMLSVLIGLGLAEGALQLMSAAGFSNFDVNVYDYPNLIGLILLVAVTTGLLAGVYPAFFLTNFKPAAVLKGNYVVGEKSKFFRSGLVVFQFVVSLTLAVFSVFVYQQLNYGLTKELGFNKEGVLVIDNSISQLGDEDENVQAFKNELLKLPSISNVSSNHYSMIGTLPLLQIVEKEGEKTPHYIQYKFTDSEFVPTMNFKMADGRNFDDELDDDRTAIIVNETFAKILGEDLYDKRFDARFNGENVKIVGIVEDFHYANFTEAIGPTVFFKREYPSQFNVRLSGQDLNQTIDQIETAYAKFTDEPLSHYFFDQKFDQLFDSEKRMSKIITIFTGLSMFVALLGLIGLISYKLDQRIKEIGIRKVLGANIGQILQLFSTEMIRLIAVALLIMIPLGFYATNSWLDGFAYHINITAMPFLMTAIFGLVITLAVVSLRTFKTASMNPIEALKDQ
jgi:putative ABC transport system permease protein